MAEVFQEANNDLAEVLVNLSKKTEWIDFKEFVEFLCDRYQLVSHEDKEWNSFDSDVQYTLIDEFERLGLLVSQKVKEKPASILDYVKKFKLAKNGTILFSFLVETRKIDKFYEA